MDFGSQHVYHYVSSDDEIIAEDDFSNPLYARLYIYIYTLYKKSVPINRVPINENILYIVCLFVCLFILPEITVLYRHIIGRLK